MSACPTQNRYTERRAKFTITLLVSACVIFGHYFHAVQFFESCIWNDACVRSFFIAILFRQKRRSLRSFSVGPLRTSITQSQSDSKFCLPSILPAEWAIIFCCCVFLPLFLTVPLTFFYLRGKHILQRLFKFSVRTFWTRDCGCH